MKDSTRVRKKFEKHIIENKSGINEMFVIKTLYDVDLLHFYTDIVGVDHNFIQ